ncbi:hypothetical protein Q3V37_20055 [Micromonospora profundi]|uniref:Uncharacterized protein n=1 Tax=Micromonospora profundi TaxID=1420889 RepID=A0AAJ6KXI5_9ACTN|nr:hypothetical protein [Micromonospora profundi]WLS43694.1 hypothetical protein Q3V37_20055 [Micromonospora profundi]
MSQRDHRTTTWRTPGAGAALPSDAWYRGLGRRAECRLPGRLHR